MLNRAFLLTYSKVVDANVTLSVQLYVPALVVMATGVVVATVVPLLATTLDSLPI